MLKSQKQRQQKKEINREQPLNTVYIELTD